MRIAVLLHEKSHLKHEPHAKNANSCYPHRLCGLSSSQLCTDVHSHAPTKSNAYRAMEPFGVIVNIAGLLDVIANRLSDLRVRLDKSRQQPKQYELLVASHARISDRVKLLAASPQDKPISGDLSLIHEHLGVAKYDLTYLTQHFDEVLVSSNSPSSPSRRRRRDRVAMFFSDLLATGKALHKTTRLEEALDSVQTQLDSSWRLLSDISLQQIKNQVSAITRTDPDGFVPNIAVRPNPDNLVLDFGLKNGKAVTCEAKLKHAVLQRDNPLDRADVIGVIGGGGTGKSCAVRAVASLSEVHMKFPDGIYEILLGMDAKELTLKNEISNCIERSGGKALAEQLTAETDMGKVLRNAEIWFGNKRILLIVDDVWESGSATGNVVFTLKRLLGSYGSCMVFTSRSSTMHPFARTVVEFELRKSCSSTSKAILLDNARMKAGDFRVARNTKSFELLLEVCDGLPAALAVAGQLMGKYGCQFPDPFGRVLSRMESKPTEVREYRPPGYKALSDLLNAAVQFCERHHGQEWQRRTGMSFEEIVQSLSVLQKQQFAPTSMLQRLWRVDNETSCQDLVEVLKDVGLVKQETRPDKNGTVVGIRIHDLFHDHFSSKANKKNSNFHARLLDGYISVPQDMKDGSCREWWRICVEENPYLYENLCRHLIRSGLLEEAVRLYLDSRWTVKQIRVRGAAESLRDYEMVMDEVYRRNTEEVDKKCIFETSTLEALKLVKDAVALAVPYVIRNGKEVWFQLYGRLIESQHVSAISKYLEGIEMYAEKPWLRASPGCLVQAGGVLERTWIPAGDQRWKTQHVFFSKDNSVCCIREKSDALGVVYEVQKLDETGEAKPTCMWRIQTKNCIQKSVVCNRGSKLGVVTHDGCVEVWDVENKVRLNCGEHQQNVTHVGQFSSSGVLWAFVTAHTNVRIWTIDGEDVQELCVLQNENPVSCLCFSGDCKAVAVGCSDGLVVMWDLRSRLVINSFYVNDRREDDGSDCESVASVESSSELWSDGDLDESHNDTSCENNRSDSKKDSTSELSFPSNEVPKFAKLAPSNVMVECDGVLLSLPRPPRCVRWDFGSDTSDQSGYSTDTSDHSGCASDRDGEGHRVLRNHNECDEAELRGTTESEEISAEDSEGNGFKSERREESDKNLLGDLFGFTESDENYVEETESRQIKNDDLKITSLAWSYDRRLIATSSLSKGTRVWALNSTEEPHVILRRALINGQRLTWSPHDIFLAMSDQNCIEVWDVRSSPSLRIKARMLVNATSTSCLNWSSDGSRLVVAHGSEMVRVTRFSEAALTGESERKTAPRWHRAVSCEDGTMLAVVGEDSVSVLDQRRNETEQVLQSRYEVATSRSFSDMAMTADGKLLAVVDDLDVLVCDVHQRKQIFSWRGASHRLQAPSVPRKKGSISWASSLPTVALSADGAKVAALLHHKVLIWNLNDAQSTLLELANVVPGFKKQYWYPSASALAWSGDGHFMLVFGSFRSRYDKQERYHLEVWDVSKPLATEKRAMLRGKGEVRRVRFNEDGDLLIEWQLRTQDEQDEEYRAIQFSVWRWRSRYSLNPLPQRRCAHAVAPRQGPAAFYDDELNCVGSFDSNIINWDYNAKSGVLTMITKFGRLLTCYLEVK